MYMYSVCREEENISVSSSQVAGVMARAETTVSLPGRRETGGRRVGRMKWRRERSVTRPVKGKWQK